jgi:hypothetical protein
MSFSEFTNNKLKKIVSVYQLNYANSVSQGFGDFLRGCFCLMQLCKKLDLEFDVDISNHPMAEYVENNGLNPNINYKNIIWFMNPNNVQDINAKRNFINMLIEHLNQQDVEVYPVFINSFPFFDFLREEGRNFMKLKIQPKQNILHYVDYTLNSIGLTRNNYGVIHIRTGDQFLLDNKSLPKWYLNKIIKSINIAIMPGKRYLILSDSNKLKVILKKTYPQFYMYIRNLEHIGGDGFKGKPNGTMNTMLDFYIMSFSNSILSISSFFWTSGFSDWCRKIYGIPFVYIKI